jgi:hypothetical protein
MFNIKSASILDQGDFTVPDAAGNPQLDADGNELTITFASPGTKKYLQAKHNLDEKKNGSVVAQMTGKASKRSYQDDINDRAEFFASITLSFNGFAYNDRAGYEGYKAMFADPKLAHVTAGADKYMADLGNFKPDLATTSPS